MGMKKRMKPEMKKPTNEYENYIEHNHQSVRNLCLAMPRIANNPGTCLKALSWAIALIIDRCVPEGQTDAALDELRNEIMLKTCMLKAFPEEKAEPLWAWVTEGTDAIDKGIN